MKVICAVAIASLFSACQFQNCFGQENNAETTVADDFQLSDTWINGMFDLIRGYTQYQHESRKPTDLSSWPTETIIGMVEDLDKDLRTLFGVDLGGHISTSWVDGFYTPPPPPDSNDLYVDEYVRALLAIQADPDCTTSQGEVDLASPDFSVERAVQVWHKCRVLVLRNAYSDELINEFRQNVTQFIYDVKDGKVNDKGTTTYKEAYYIHEVESLRWDMLMPPQFARDPHLMAHPTIMDIITDNRVLGEDISCMANGMFFAEPAAKGQMWHTDTPGLFSDYRGLEEHGLAGHEVPTASLTMFAPLQNMSGELGPTQFCVGAHALNGLDITSGFKDKIDGGWLKFKDPQLKEDLLDLVNIADDVFHDEFITGVCPLGMWYSPILNLGDVAFWDYAAVHRSGPNDSKDIFRSAVYVSYTRNGVKDAAFDGFRRGELGFEASSYITAKFSKPAYGWDNSRGDNDKPILEYYYDDDDEELQDENVPEHHMDSDLEGSLAKGDDADTAAYCQSSISSPEAEQACERGQYVTKDTPRTPPATASLARIDRFLQ
jgi:ectoine hydroxylase-related dioxygenase (phytanoyl-CoA dioxygenase family)